jgi:hypothetical protein
MAMVIIAVLGMIVTLQSWVVMQVVELRTRVEVAEARQSKLSENVKIQTDVILRYHLKPPGN